MSNKPDGKKGQSMSGTSGLQQPLQPKNVHCQEDTEVKSSETNVREDESSTLSGSIGRLLTVASFLGLMLALLGYGVALAAEGRFGVPRAQMIDSTLDMWELSTWAVLQVLSRGFTAFEDSSLYLKALNGMRPVALTALVGWLLLVGIFVFHGRWKKRPKKASQKPHGKQEDTGTVSYALKKTWWIPASVLLTPLALMFGIVIMIFMATLLTIVPIVGMSAGEAHIDQYVVAPEHCVPMASRAARLKKKLQSEQPTVQAGAQCVSVKFTEGDVQIRGRVVFALSKTLILYDPATGAVQRVPTANAIVEVVSTL